MMNKKQTQRLLSVLAVVAGFVFLILLWWMISAILESQGNHLCPDPWVTFGRLFMMLFGGYETKNTYLAIGWTFLRLLIGFISSFIVASILGIIAGLHRYFEKFMKPIITFCRTVPTAAVVLILAGIFLNIKGLPSYIPCFLVFLVAFPVIYQAYVDGIHNEDQLIKDAAQLDIGYKSISSVTNVIVPDIAPYILLSIVQSLGLSMKVSIMSEIVTASSESTLGIGSMIAHAKNYELDMVAILAYSLLAIIIIALIDIPLQYIKKKIKK